MQLPLYENANIEAINPMFFVWDVTKYKLGKKETWDSCPKIFKRFETIENIKNNPQYKLTKEQIEDLDDEKTSSPVDCESDRQLADLCKYGEMHEALYFHGDLKFNGVRYKNVVIEVLARKYIIRFEQNPIYINPFIVGFTEIDPYTKRGISPLKSILDMAEVKEEKINQASDIATLNANPPHWVSDAFLKEKYRGGVIEYEPGKCLEYENSYYDTKNVINSKGEADYVITTGSTLKMPKFVQHLYWDALEYYLLACHIKKLSNPRYEPTMKIANDRWNLFKKAAGAVNCDTYLVI